MSNSNATVAPKSPLDMFRVKFSVKLMVQIAMLIALEIVLNRYLSIRTPIVKIGFAFVPIVICAAAYGPIWSGAVCLIADVLGTLIEGNVPLPGLSLSCLLRGLVLGFFLFGMEDFKPTHIMSYIRIILPVCINQLLFSLVANSYWLWSAGFYGGSLTATIVARLPQTALLIPVQVIVTPLLLRTVSILRRQRLLA